MNKDFHDETFTTEPVPSYTSIYDETSTAFKEKDVLEEHFGPYTSYVLGGFWLRFLAFVFDLLVVFALRGIFLSPLKLYISPYSIILKILQLLVLLLYFVLLTKLNHGQTLGKMVFGLKVISLNREELSWSDVITRECFCRYIQQVIPLLYVITAFTKKKQNVGDLFSDTVVIKTGLLELLNKPIQV